MNDDPKDEVIRRHNGITTDLIAECGYADPKGSRSEVIDALHSADKDDMDIVRHFEPVGEFWANSVVDGIGVVGSCRVFAFDGVDDDLVVCVFLDTEGFQAEAVALHLSAIEVVDIRHHLSDFGGLVGRALRLKIDCPDDELGIGNGYP